MVERGGRAYGPSTSLLRIVNKDDTLRRDQEGGKPLFTGLWDL